ncbi:rhodanese-like domain-containing protein [Kozakia baliensis]|uniref:Uncharacterized protein n=1 Tax=Kozakia baliensis TaxID=153496 RepID=A0A1D8UVC2_9PROT|nr:rhodanese-like domain-containing protein [Kozakia baliensis]AOX17594.1 hypothetical protein A0U89_11055 [Kozakia baliensis]GBR31105.1 sulfide dehydrogenase [Kozakia baliensis NRIC 0488]GEL62925.1 hypothetical protein KBA01_02110 [Kozakia baliensis]
MVGSISARKAWEALERDPSAVLIDVRTPPEWASVGLPDLSTLGRHTLAITWDPYSANIFAKTLREAVPDQKTPIYFLCRSGARSQATAELAEDLGYETSINIVEGYEGPPDSTGARGHVCGWQKEGLPTRKPG